MIGQRAVGDTGLDEHPAGIGRGDRGQIKSSKVNQGRRLFNAALHQVDEVGSAGEVFRTGSGRTYGIVDRSGMSKGESLHAEPFSVTASAADAMASTMLAYAP